jgi:peptidoglycan-associated lipoprotein
MKHSMIIGLAIAELAVSGCTKKAPPASAASDPAASSIYAPPAAEEPPVRSSGLSQADLIAAAGADRVLFALDSYSLSAEAEAVLARQVAWLKAHPQVGFTIEGHCDERGTREYNLALGDRRANAVASFMSANGISPERLRSLSYGKERPEVTGSDDVAYAQNRRAVSVVIDTGR